MDSKQINDWSLRIVRKQARDGVWYWVILGIYNDGNAFDKCYFGRYKTLKQARAKLGTMNPDKTLHTHL